MTQLNKKTKRHIGIWKNSTQKLTIAAASHLNPWDIFHSHCNRLAAAIAAELS